ncbi:hypothetical protein GEMMAAP_15950 [Gemmatimonas phototrophica]|uniref:Uncharacterized protein n=2 Tax=Gemmatimonas phototrophica TaxID=1379270 RepID=A0A143BMY9_9BACT|nr:hypothetical protein GEMMAAP_15950 [Gemmatimonas phototrophica]
MILRSLTRYVDDDEVDALWRQACHQAGFDVHRLPHSTDELLPVVDALEQLSDLAAVCAKGLRIRIMSYAVLARAGKGITATPTVGV